jgi:DNA-directed RNA polymerase specialized sigma24 family protein
MIVSIDLPAAIARDRQAAETRRPSDVNEQSHWQAEFLRLVPRIRRYAEMRFRHVNPADRDDAVQEVIARALLQFLRLWELGKADLIYAGPLARYAVAQVRGGRRVGGRLNIRDVSSTYCRARKGVSLESLDRCDDASDCWQEVLVEDRQATPADVAAARIDVREWLRSLPRRNRRLAERLATGESTSGAAQMFGISRSRVSQLRRELKCAWNTFQGEPAAALR